MWFRLKQINIICNCCDSKIRRNTLGWPRSSLSQLGWWSNLPFTPYHCLNQEQKRIGSPSSQDHGGSKIGIPQMGCPKWRHGPKPAVQFLVEFPPGEPTWLEGVASDPAPAQSFALWHSAPSLMVYSLCTSSDVSLASTTWLSEISDPLVFLLGSREFRKSVFIPWYSWAKAACFAPGPLLKSTEPNNKTTETHANNREDQSSGF